MSTTLRVLVKLTSNTGLARDIIENTWHCQSDSADVMDDAEGFRDALLAWYLSLDTFMSSRLNGAVEFNVYDLTDPTPRVPILVSTSALEPGTGFGLPNEVAICASFQGAVGAGVNMARRRGRIFFGPLDGGVVDDGTGDTIVDASVTASITDVCDTLMGAGSEGGFQWAVFSPTTAGPPPWSFGDLAVATFPVVSGWCDNAFDTVRSRGGAATERAVFP